MEILFLSSSGVHCELARFFAAGCCMYFDSGQLYFFEFLSARALEQGWFFPCVPGAIDTDYFPAGYGFFPPV